MTIRNFWRLFIKALGLWVTVLGITVSMNFISSVVSIDRSYGNYSILVAIFLFIITGGFYYLVIKAFLFKTEWFIDKLRLDKGFDDERIDLSISTQTFTSIIVSVLGGIYFLDGIPSLFKNTFSFFQQSHIFRQSPSSSFIIYYLVQVVIGFILMTNGKYLAKILIKHSSEKSEAE